MKKYLEPDRINEEPAIIFQTDVNPFQKDLINEFKGKSEKDELYVEEITRNLINEILNEFWTSTFLEKNRVFHKLKHFFLKTPLIVNNEKIAFKMPDDVEISLALFQNKHINELFKYLYNSLIELVLSIN